MSMLHIAESKNFDEDISEIIFLISANKINPLYTGGLFHCCMLDKSICHFRGVSSILSLLFYFWWKVLLANNVDPHQMPHHVASDLGLHCLPMILLRDST